MSETTMLDYFEIVSDQLVSEIESVIELLASDQETRMFAVQPVSSVVHLAAVAAASVIVAFEHGYQMSDKADDEH